VSSGRVTASRMRSGSLPVAYCTSPGKRSRVTWARSKRRGVSRSLFASSCSSVGVGFRVATQTASTRLAVEVTRLANCITRAASTPMNGDPACSPSAMTRSTATGRRPSSSGAKRAARLRAMVSEVATGG
jgi:hypothetical protein